MTKILTIIGARPQFIKSGVVSLKFRQAEINEVVVHTGQHFDANMSDIFFKQMQLSTPNYILDINNVGHGAMTGRMLEKIEEIILIEQPNYLLVYGDTNSTLAGALAASKLHIPIIHIEAGLRSFNMQMPEEINRIITDRISQYLFCPTQTAVNNLKREGFGQFTCKIEMVGDVMYDSFLHFKQHQKRPVTSNMRTEKFILTTIHRAENTDNQDYLTNIVKYLNELNKEYQVISPLHPRTKNKIINIGVVPEFMIIDPVGYLEMLWLLNNAQFIVTDSGGLQKEAYFARKKCITLRSETEWVELVDSGWNKLYDPKNNIILNSEDLHIPLSYNNLYGSGNACDLIVTNLTSF